MPFQTDREDLRRMLDAIHDGTLQLPDFQRDWVWDDLRIRDLIASVAQGWPIGAVLLLESGGQVRFRLRCFEGAPQHPTQRASRLALDGQQRLTSLYLALRSGKPVPTHVEPSKKTVLRHYAFDLRKWFDPEIDKREAILSLPEDKILRTAFNRDVHRDLSTPAKQYEERCIPVETALQDGLKWGLGFMKAHQYSGEATELWTRFAESAVDQINRFQVPYIQLDRSTDRAAVCAVFEKVNQGGKPLDTFELLTATFAGEEEGFRLADEWKSIHGRLKMHLPVLADLKATDFLQAVTLLASYRTRKGPIARRVGCRREEMLALPLADWKDCAPEIERGFEAAARMLDAERIFDTKWLPYQNQLIPMATIAAILGNRFGEDPCRRNILRWYWCGVLGELYGGSTETRYGRDVIEVSDWKEDGPEPTTIKDCSIVPADLLRLTTRNSAAYKGVMALFVKHGSQDLLSGEKLDRALFFQGKKNKPEVDIHHIFPAEWCMTQGLSHSDSILNKTPLRARTNRIIGKKAPSRYLADFEGPRWKILAVELDARLASHSVPIAELRSDDYVGFLRERAVMLLDLIEAATGKVVVGRDSEQTIKAFGGHLLKRVAPPPPQVLFGDLVVESRISGAGMSECFLVRSPQWGPAFLKRAPLETQQEKALQREQGIYQRLSHVDLPGVLKVFDFVRDQTHVGLVLERAQGSLSTWVDAHGYLSGSDVASTAEAIIEGLENLHGMGIVHRDLKPDNVMYQIEEGAAPVWKLADFGIAKNTLRYGSQTFQGHGTLGYMAPEQRAGVEAHASADVYSLGKVICWMLTGGTDPDLIVPPAWRDLVDVCVEEDPKARTSLEKVRGALERIVR